MDLPNSCHLTSTHLTPCNCSRIISTDTPRGSFSVHENRLLGTCRTCLVSLISSSIPMFVICRFNHIICLLDHSCLHLDSSTSGSLHSIIGRVSLLGTTSKPLIQILEADLEESHYLFICCVRATDQVQQESSCCSLGG